MYRKPSFLNPFARGSRKSDPPHWAQEYLDPLHPHSTGPSSCPAASTHSWAPRPPIAGSFLHMHTTGASQTFGASYAPAAQARKYRDVGVQTDDIEDLPDPQPPRKGSSKLKEAGRILLGKTFGWRTKTKHARVALAEVQPPPHPHLRPAVPQRPPRPEGFYLDSETREWGRRMINDALDAQAPFGSPLLASPVARNLVGFPKMEDSTEEASDHDESSEVQPKDSQPLVASSPYSFFSVPTPPSSSSPSVYGSSDITSQSSALSCYVRQKPADAQAVGVSLQDPDYAQAPDMRWWPVVQHNLIEVPPLREGKWLTGGVLGTGGFARVYKVFNVALKKSCALKAVRIGQKISGSACAGIINELKVLSVLAEEESPSLFLLQPFLADKLWAWRSSAGNLHIATELCEGGSLAAYRFRIGYDSLVMVSAEIILGLNWLHEHGIVHHDLKPHNVMISGNGHCVIGDYGGARFLDDDGKITRANNTSIVMTTAFAAPEILEPLEEGEVREYDEAADYWSFGVTLIAMFMNEEFLPGSSDMALMAFRVDRIKEDMEENGAPEELQAFVMDLLRMDPTQRCNYPKITKQRLFQHLNWQDVESQARPVLVPRELVCDAHGWEFRTPGGHRTQGSTADFLEELRAHHLSVEVDDSYDLERHHAVMSQCLCGRVVPYF